MDCTGKSVVLFIGHIQGKPFLDHWTCDSAFKLIGSVVLLVSVGDRQSFAMSEQ